MTKFVSFIVSVVIPYRSKLEQDPPPKAVACRWFSFYIFFNNNLSNIIPSSEPRSLCLQGNFLYQVRFKTLVYFLHMYLSLLEVFLISIVPISLIKFRIVPSKFRLIILLGVFTSLVGSLYFQNISLGDLGASNRNFSYAVLPYLYATLISVLILIITSKIRKNKKANKWYENPHFLFLFIPISLAQQLLFQGFILLKLVAVLPQSVAIIITALIFGYMHTIYPKPFFSMILGTLAGLLFATLYLNYPNFILVSLMHSILNFTAVYLGFFTFLDSEGIPKKTELNLA